MKRENNRMERKYPYGKFPRYVLFPSAMSIVLDLNVL